MKKIKNIIFTLLLVGLISLPLQNPRATTYTDSFTSNSIYIRGDYITKTNGVSTRYQQMTVITRNSDGQFVYCIEPGTPITSNSTEYEGQDFDQAYITNMTDAQWERIVLLAYYGYGYEGHTDIKWYSITQYLIWLTVPHGYDIYFTDTLNGNRIEKYTEEIAELNRLVENHKTEPNFNVSEIKMLIGETIELTDINGVLSEYEINSTQNVSANITGNTISITAEGIGDASVTLTKNPKNYSNPAIVYIHPTSQNIMSVGMYDPITINLNISVTGGQLEVNKTGENLVIEDDSYYYEEISLEGVEFELRANEDIVVGEEIYYYKDDLVAILITDELGYTSIGNLPFGKYYIKEIKSSNNNVIDLNVYEFELTYENQNEIISLYNKYISGTLEFTKTDIVTGDPLPNTKIEIYTEDDIKVFEGYTNEEGKIVIEDLPVGKYYLVEVEAPDGYILNTERMYFEIKENGEVVKADMINEQIIDVPDTGISDSKVLNIVGIVAIILGLGYIVYDKFKNKK